MQGKPIHKKYLVALLFVISLLIYGRTLRHEFLWDDQRSHLSSHKALMEGDLKTIWSKPYDGMYIPVTYTTWSMLREIGWNDEQQQLSPVVFHFANMLFHSFNSILVFFLLLLFFRNTYASLAGSLLFAVHPIQVESVAWISEFRGVYSAFFGLSAIFVLFRHVSHHPAMRVRELMLSKAFLASSLLFACALLSKPSAVAFPFLTVLLCWCFYPLSFRTMALAMLSWLIMIIPVMLVTSGSQTNEILTFVTPLPSRIFLFCYSAWFYITKITMPLKLVPSYGLTPEIILEDSWIYIYAFIIIGLSVILFVKRARFRIFFTGYFFLLLCILPVSGIISFYFQRYSNVADRYVYLGMTGTAIVFAYLWMMGEKRPYLRYILSAFLLCIAALSLRQTSVWKNEFSIWDHSLKHYPDQFTAAYNRGVCYGKQGKLDQAITDYTTAIQFNNKDKNTFVNRANAYAQRNRYQEALQDYNAAIRLDQRDGSIYYNRALTHYNIGNYKACPADIQKAQELRFPVDPEFIKAVHIALGAVRQ